MKFISCSPFKPCIMLQLITTLLPKWRVKPITKANFYLHLELGECLFLNLVDNIEVNGNIERKVYTVIAGHVHQSL